jgi:uncharacterized protein (DUF305 family)
MSWRIGVAAIVVAAAVAVVAVLVIGGGDDTAEAKETDGAFIAEMIPHHESAIEMAEIALDRTQHPEIQQLARAIIDSQSAEIESLESAHERLFGEPVSAADHGTLGLSEAEMGLHGQEHTLAEAKPFDREFIDMMVPHHQGAIRMARIELAQGQDPELERVAEAIIEAQSREIEEMNSWRQDWYGAPSPAGGVPPEDASETPSHEEMGHG